VSRTTLLPTFTVLANVQGTDLGSVLDRLNPILAELRKEQKPGNRIVIAGQAALMESAYRELFGGLILSAVLIFLVMVVNFQSWALPLAAISGLPGALSAAQYAADPRQANGGAPAFEEVVTPTEDGFAAQSRFTGRDGRTFEGSAEVRTTEDVEVQANFQDGRGNRIELNAAVSGGRLDVNAVRTDAEGQTQAVQQNQARRLFGRGTVLDFAA
jgi:hypothetical protein